MSDEIKFMCDIKCRLCGQDAGQASERGAYLKRVSPKGGEFIAECAPSCDMVTGDQDDALLRAIMKGAGT